MLRILNIIYSLVLLLSVGDLAVRFFQIALYCVAADICSFST